MDGEVFLDTVLLRQHVAEIEQERRTAQRLYDQLEAAKALCAPEDQERYHRLLDDVQGLVRYFRAMANVVDDISTNAELTSIKIGQLIQNTTDSASLRTIFRQ